MDTRKLTAPLFLLSSLVLSACASPRLTIDTTPQGASVYTTRTPGAQQRRLLGETPLQGAPIPNSSTGYVLIEKPGYEPELIGYYYALDVRPVTIAMLPEYEKSAREDAKRFTSDDKRAILDTVAAIEKTVHSPRMLAASGAIDAETQLNRISLERPHIAASNTGAALREMVRKARQVSTLDRMYYGSNAETAPAYMLAMQCEKIRGAIIAQ